MRKYVLTRWTAAMLAAAVFSASAASASECDPAVQSVMDKQVSSYIAANGDLASQNFSHRPGNFASTTCLDNLMKGGGLDIFFKPQGLDTLLGMVKNMACEQASQIFDSLVGGSGLNGGGSLNPGEILKGINLGGSLVSIGTSSGSGGGSVDATIKSLFK
jgi:hypothetical protein